MLVFKWKAEPLQCGSCRAVKCCKSIRCSELNDLFILCVGIFKARGVTFLWII